MNYMLRPFTMNDAASVARYANNSKIAQNLRNVFPHPYTAEDAHAFLSACVEKEGNRQMIRAICVDGEAVGSIGIFCKEDVYEKSGELGYWLGEPFWGRGIVTQAVRQICDETFAAFDLVRIFAEPYAHNNGSRRVLEKAGFTLEGIMRKSVYKNGVLMDSCLYAQIKEG